MLIGRHSQRTFAYVLVHTQSTICSQHGTHVQVTQSFNPAGRLVGCASSPDVSRPEPCPAKVRTALHERRRLTIREQQLRSFVHRCRKIARVCVDPTSSPLCARTFCHFDFTLKHSPAHVCTPASTACASVKPCSPRLRQGTPSPGASA